MDTQQFFGEIGGLPFIDDHTVEPRTLLSAVAMVRRRADPEAFETAVDYLHPGNAAQIFDRHATSTPGHIDWVEMPPPETAQVEEAQEAVLAAKPEWSALFRIPKRYRRMSQSTSSTSVLVPQTIYLGPGAFRDDETLRETLVHEHAHIWLNFIAEVFDLQTPDAPSDYVLPSGTSGKTYRGVLFAAHFAAAGARALDARVESEPATQPRRDYLIDYLRGCLDTLHRRPHGTVMGDLVRDRLQIVVPPA